MFIQMQEFLQSGSEVLWVILGMTVAIWMLLTERFLYLKLDHPKVLANCVDACQKIQKIPTKFRIAIYRKNLSEVRVRMESHVRLIRILVALCPLLGLLGTVTGMIHIFDIMALAGSVNPRAMAAGISMATIPTMAGMIAAISGIYFIHKLDVMIRVENNYLNTIG